MATFYRTADG